MPLQRLECSQWAHCRRARSDQGVIDYAYLADLRLGARMTPTLRREWQHFYASLIQDLRHLRAARRPQAIITAVLDDNARAVRLLTKRITGVRYVPLQQYASVTALAPLPWARRQVTGVRIRWANSSDAAGIRAVLATSSASRAIGEHFVVSGEGENEDELARRFRDWRGFSELQFVVAESDSGQLLAVVAPRRNQARSLVVRKVSQAVRLVTDGARRLGLSSLELPGPLDLLYLTHFECDLTLSPRRRTEIGEAMLFFVWKHVLRPTGGHGVCFAAWPAFAWPVGSLRGWVQHVESATLYQVVAADQEPCATWVHAAQCAPLPFDLSSS